MTTQITEDWTLERVMAALELTADESWLVDRCRSPDHQQHCVLSHLFNLGGNELCSAFENRISTEFVFFPINDGRDPRYPQATPKARILAYLADLRDGKEQTVEAWEREMMVCFFAICPECHSATLTRIGEVMVTCACGVTFDPYDGRSTAPDRR